MNSRHPRVGILGAGLAGLSASNTLQEEGIDHFVLEKEEVYGGLARSFEVNGFHFDCSGHLLHLRDSALRASVLSASPRGSWVKVSRRSSILLEGNLIRYPFQGNLVDAPRHIRDECLATLPDPTLTSTNPRTLDEWVDLNLGEGIARWFMRPYNEKLFGVPLKDLTSTALGRFLPRVNRDSIVKGAKEGSPAEGYNASFLYPKQGGISLLPSFFADNGGRILLQSFVSNLDLEERYLETEDGRTFHFPGGLISSIPLPSMMRIAGLGGGERLRARSVTCVNLGFPKRPSLLRDSHWVYLPEQHFHAYRTGLYSNITSGSVPDGCAAAYIEIAHWGDLDDRDALQKAVEDAIALELITDPRDLLATHIFRIPEAYVVIDSDYQEARSSAVSKLSDSGVQLAGRYGLWEYGSMEDAIQQGVSAARQIRGSTGD